MSLFSFSQSSHSCGLFPLSSFRSLCSVHVESVSEPSSLSHFTAGFASFKVFALVLLPDSLSSIMITRPCNVYPLTPHFYIVKLGFTGVYIIFALNIDCGCQLESPR